MVSVCSAGSGTLTDSSSFTQPAAVSLSAASLTVRPPSSTPSSVTLWKMVPVRET